MSEISIIPEGHKSIYYNKREQITIHLYNNVAQVHYSNGKYKEIPIKNKKNYVYMLKKKNYKLIKENKNGTER